MMELIAIIIVLACLVWYLTTREFTLGTGFTEMKRKAREGEYEVLTRKEPVREGLEEADATARDTKAHDATPKGAGQHTDEQEDDPAKRDGDTAAGSPRA